MFFTNLIWWLLLILSLVIIGLLAWREAFRYRILFSRFSKALTYLPILGIIIWVSILVIMFFISGILSSITAFLFCFIFGSSLVIILKRLFIEPMEETLSKWEWDSKVDEFLIDKALNSKVIQELLIANNANENEIHILYQKLKRCGIQQSKIEKAILNPELIKWYLISSNSKEKRDEDFVIELSLYARYGKIPKL